MARRCSTVAGLLIASVVATVAGEAHAEPWVDVGPVTSGTQFDVVAGPAGRLHIISDQYVQLDANGSVLVSESVGDIVSHPFQHAPAIAIDPDGTVHVALRDGGDFDGGFTLRYRTRTPDGTWSNGFAYSAPVQWNWQVGIATDGAGTAYLLATEKGGDVWANLRIFQANGSGVMHLGDIEGWYRVDNSALLRSRGGVIALASGDNSQPTRLGIANAGAGLVGELSAGATHSAGAGDHGLPDVFLDEQDGIHFTYGSGLTNHDQFPGQCPGCIPGEVHYARYSSAGAVTVPDQTVITGLDTWHLSIGMSAVGASDDGDEVVVAALEAHDMKAANASNLITSFSIDGGTTWSPQLDTGRTINGGEGRLRLRMASIGDRVFLLAADNAAPNQVSLSYMQFPDDGEGESGTGSTGEPPMGTTGDVDPQTSGSTSGGAEAGGSEAGVGDNSTGSGGGTDDSFGLSPTQGTRTPPGGCGCSSGRESVGFAWMFLLVLLLRRRQSGA